MCTGSKNASMCHGEFAEIPIPRKEPGEAVRTHRPTPRLTTTGVVLLFHS